MLKLNFKNADAAVIGEENGLNINQEFENYRETISNIIKSLNQRKDKPGQWLQWMNLGYNEETVWYVKEFASMVKGKFDNILVLGIGGSALGGMAVTEALLKPYWNLLTKEQRNKINPIKRANHIRHVLLRLSRRELQSVRGKQTSILPATQRFQDLCRS